MLRYALIGILLFIVPSTASAQRVFRASIDQEQNDRLDKLEDAVDRLTTLVEILAVEKEKSKPVVASLSLPEVKAPPVVKASPVPSSHYSRAELESIVRAAYPSGNYTQYADVSPRSGVWRHLQDGNHRFTSAQVSGMSQDIALGLHGLHHAGRISPYKNSFQQSKQSLQQAQLVTRASPSVQQMGGCANGQCARQVTTRNVVFARRGFFR